MREDTTPPECRKAKNQGKDPPEQGDSRLEEHEPGTLFPLSYSSASLQRQMLFSQPQKEESKQLLESEARRMEQVQQSVAELNTRAVSHSQSLGRLFEKVNELEESLARGLRVGEVQTLLHRVAGDQQELGNELAKQAAVLEQLAAQGKVLEHASVEMSRLGDRFYEERVVQPMVKSIFPLFDLLESFRTLLLQGRTLDTKDWFRLLDALQTEVTEFLAPYEIEPFQHSPGDPFKPQSMAPVRTERTADPKMHHKVARSCQAGFRWNQRIVRLEKIVLWEYAPSSGAEEMSQEGGHS